MSIHTGIKYRAILFFSLFLTIGVETKANVTLPKLFSDHVVLQREVEVPVWGWATPGEKVTVRIGGQSVKTKADANGNWKLRLAPQAAGGPFELTDWKRYGHPARCSYW
jgi:sialate O-acetylesterase